MGQYFQNDPLLKHRLNEVKFTIKQRPFTLTTDSGMFSRTGLDRGTHIILQTLLKLNLGQRVLDMGCGYGPIGIVLATFNPQVQYLLADINQTAVSMAVTNIQRLKLKNAEAIVSDLYQKVTGRFDSIVSNPPVRAGKKVTYALYEKAREWLTPNGTLYVVLRKAQGAESATKFLKTLYDQVEIIDREAGYHIIAARLIPKE